MPQSATAGVTGTLAELFALAADVESAVGELLDHSGTHYHDVNANSGVFFVGWNPHRWDELDGSGQAALGKARKVAEQWRELARSAIEASVPARLKNFDREDRSLKRILDRDKSYSAGVPGRSIEGARTAVAQALANQREVLQALPSAHGEGGRLLVPDTNATIFKPALETWAPGNGRWTLVLVPQVIRELDEKKMNPHIGEKATSVIKRLKEYGRRGDTFDGIRVAGDLWLREVAIEADMTKTLNWLRPGHADDQLLASVLELKWTDLRADVFLVTRDRNLQNKARLARVRTVDVEDI